MNTAGTLASFSNVAAFVWPVGNTRKSRDHGMVRAIRQRTESFHELTDQQLTERVGQLRQTVQTGTDPMSKEVLVTGFALVSEAVLRVLGISYYDVQLLAGLALSRGQIAEMQTGEGKTIVAALPACIHALAGKGVHVMTINDYLAQRDHEQLSPVFHLLGLSIGFLQPGSGPEAKRQAYACDVTYGPGYEFGFDYLRDQASLLARKKPRLGERYSSRLRGRCDSTPQSIQRQRFFCVVDEIDSVLIDEATTPLLLSEGKLQSSADANVYLLAKKSAKALEDEQDYVIDRIANRVSLTPVGMRTIAEIGNAAARYGLLRPWAMYVRQALQATFLLQQDVDYVVKEGRILLVDKNTGRIFPDRSWRDGLHQTIEAKEDLAITPEQRPLGHITRQRYFQLYEGKCGMTGTATGNEGELRHFYRLGVVVMPTRKPSRRVTMPTRFFADQASKFRAVIADIIRIHPAGQPILVGTRTIETSELLAAHLRTKGVSFLLLNGKQDEQEARIIAHAGELGAITIATNMAGRGTDIRLGPGVVQRGGLHVIGTERHESARVDRQLIGRAARQGDPGSCQFFVSAEDRLVTMHAPSLSRCMDQSARDNGESQVDFSRKIVKAQVNAERLGFVQRQQMFAHDHWLDSVLATLSEER